MAKNIVPYRQTFLYKKVGVILRWPCEDPIYKALFVRIFSKFCFQVRSVEVNLNLVRYKDLTEPLVQIKPPQESQEKIINESFKESFAEDPAGEFKPYKYYENEFDYHFMEADVKKGFLNKLGEEAQRDLGLYEEKEEERRQRGLQKSKRKYGRFGNHEKFRNKKFGSW